MEGRHRPRNPERLWLRAEDAAAPQRYFGRAMDQHVVAEARPQGPSEGWRTDAAYWLAQVRQLFSLALPFVLSQLAVGLMSTVTMLFVGRFDVDRVGGVALALSWMNLTGYSLIYGLASALDSLCAMSFGAGDLRKMTAFLQRGLLIGAMVCFPVAAAWWVSDFFFGLLQIDIVDAEHATLFLRCSIPALLPVMAFEKIKRYLQAMHRIGEIVIVTFSGLLLHCSVCYLLVVHMKLGYIGAAFAQSCTYWTMLTILCYVVFIRDKNHSFEPWVESAFEDWGTYLSLGIPGILQVMLEWVAFEITLLEAAWLGRDVLAAQGILLNICYLSFIVPFSLGQVVSVLVGNQVGAQSAKGAKDMITTSVLSTLCICGAVSFTFFLGAHNIARLFVTDEHLVSMIGSVSWIYALYFLSDGLQVTLCGGLRGFGLQRIAAVGALVGFWGLTLPLTYLLAFKSTAFHGLRGLWAAFMFAELPLASGYLLYFYVFCDFQSMIKLAAERLSLTGAEGSNEGNEKEAEP
ncbi:Multidrug and toxin extrusion protein 2 [Porphyridium purpureum]|uniref:Multidrug and toxin extrusion protein 2 n=1 Tax=Porphyridium purpureum TaxID=35688 RepID=A0A5J4YW20_PORPP|nr:Multidrug and toxin extrusion protein 2 [Porphyridium purpureum]|eukprot:POR8705..scf209_3